MINFEILLPSAFASFAPAAVQRLGYLFPTAIFHFDGDRINVEADDKCNAENLRAEVLYSVYRQKIYEETLDMRRTLLEALTST